MEMSLGLWDLRKIHLRMTRKVIKQKEMEFFRGTDYLKNGEETHCMLHYNRVIEKGYSYTTRRKSQFSKEGPIFSSQK